MQRIDQSYCGQNPVQINACKGCSENFWAAKVRHQHLAEVGARAAVVTYPSRFAKELCEASGFAQGKGIVWENGVHLPGPDFFETQKIRRTKDRRLTFGYLGGPSHIKGWPLIRQAFSDLGRDDFKVHLGDGSLDGRWWANVDLSELQGEWQVHPRFAQSDMDGFYAQIDVLLFMSQWKETYGLAVREALARGIKVIQTNSGGTVEHDGVKDPPPIKIGAPATELQSALKDVFQGHWQGCKPVAVQSFEAQAETLDGLIQKVLSVGVA